MTTPGLDGLIRQVQDAFLLIEEWVHDTSTIAFLVDAQDALEGVTDNLKILVGSVQTKLRTAALGGPQFLPDGRTLRIAEEPKRTMRAGGRVVIRDRIRDKALAMAQGEAGEAVQIAISLTEDAYISASTMPKWGALASLGFTSWDEVADTTPKVKGVEVAGTRETTRSSEDPTPT